MNEGDDGDQESRGNQKVKAITGERNKQANGKLLTFPTAKSRPQPNSELPTFKKFHQMINNGDITEASELLSELLGIPLANAHASAKFFAKKQAIDLYHSQKAMMLYSEVDRDRTNDALILFKECFGLEGPFAIIALQTLLTTLRK